MYMSLVVKLKDSPDCVKNDLNALERYARGEINFTVLKSKIEKNNDVWLEDSDVISLINLGYQPLSKVKGL